MDDGYPVATCRFYEIAENAVTLGRVVVLPEYRDHKLGTLVVTEAEKWAKELGYSEIIIDSRVEVVEFYTKLGYLHLDDHVERCGSFECIKMKKEL